MYNPLNKISEGQTVTKLTIKTSHRSRFKAFLLDNNNHEIELPFGFSIILNRYTIYIEFNFPVMKIPT